MVAVVHHQAMAPMHQRWTHRHARSKAMLNATLRQASHFLLFASNSTNSDKVLVIYKASINEVPRPMLSALSILLGLAVIMVFLNRTQIIADPGSRVMLSFIGSLSVLSSFYFCLLLLPHQAIWIPRSTLILTLLAFAGIISLNKYHMQVSMRDIAYVSGWSLVASKEDIQTPKSLTTQKGRSLYRLVFAASCLIIFIANAINPSPADWDSNTYNVARLSSMIAGASPFLGQTSVARQAVLSISHDLLFYPDILFHNTRGLGLVCGLEFIALMCILSQVSLHFILRLHQSSIPRKDISVYPALLLGLCLLLTSDMLSMQSVITKNDLIITLCFTSGLYLACRFISKEISTATLFAGSTLVGAYSLSSKNYGIISLFPLATLIIIAVFRVAHLRPSPSINSWLTFNSLKRKVSGFFSQLATIGTMGKLSMAGLVALSITLLCIDYSIKRFASAQYAPEISQITQSWTNTGNSPREAIFIFMVNFARNTLSILLYSITSIPFLGSRISPQVTKMFNFNFLNLDVGTGGGTKFQWPVYSHASSHTSIFVILSLALALLVWRRLSSSYSAYLLPNLTSLNKDLSRQFCIITTNCILAYITITFAVLYQPWIGRFLGPSYAPLIPVSSFILAQYSYLNRNRLHKFRLLSWAGIYISIISLLIFMSHVKTSSLSSDINLSISSRHIDIPLADRRYASHIATITETEPSSYGPLLNHLRNSEFGQRVLCTGEDSWMLTPMMSSMENKSYNGSNLTSISTAACDKLLGIAKKSTGGSVETKSLTPSIIKRRNTEFIYLP